MRKIFLIAIGLGIAISGFSQVSTIADAKAAGTGTTPTVSGVVINGDELGPIRYIQDATGGLAIYDPTQMASVVLGDSITVSGPLVDYENLLEIQPVNTVVVEKKDAILPNPIVLTPSQLGEAYEGMLVRINDAEFALAGGEFASGVNYNFTAGGETSEIRIGNVASPFVGQVIPSGKVIIIGILSQYKDTYQILVRETDDIRSPYSINFLSSPNMKDLTTSGFTLEWETDSAGTTELFYGNTPDLEIGKLSAPGEGTQHSISIAGADPSELFYVKPFSVRGQDTATVLLQVYVTQSISSGEMIAYFNRPVDNSVSMGTDAVHLPDAIDDTLIAYINRAEESIDFTIYNFNNTGISNISTALNNAHSRGVKVRVVYDINQNNFGTDELASEIGKMASPLQDYPNYGIMHNKFIVFDALSSDPNKAIVWTGATNLTDGQINVDPNNVIIIQDKSLAIAYRLEFNEMFGSAGLQPDPSISRFGPDKLDNTPHEFIIGGSRVESYFSPSDPTHKKIISTIKTADKEIFVATMLITKTDIGYEIRDKKEAGIKAEVLVKDEESCNETVVTTLKNSLADNFRVSGESGIMHHKYMIVDQSDAGSDPILLTGCHNWSSSAQYRNDENTLIIHNQTIANIYYQEFVSRFKNGKLLVDAPDCEPDWGHMTGGSSFRWDVLYNDDIPGPVTIEINRQPANGTGTVETDKTITYRPDAGFRQGLDTVFYKVCMEANSNICDSSWLVVWVDLPVSTSELEAGGGISIYPNPAKDLVQISNLDAYRPEKLRVMDLTGRVLITDTRIREAESSYSLDLGDLQKGFYYIVFERDGNQKSIHPIMIQ